MLKGRLLPQVQCHGMQSAEYTWRQRSRFLLSSRSTQPVHQAECVCEASLQGPSLTVIMEIWLSSVRFLSMHCSHTVTAHMCSYFSRRAMGTFSVFCRPCSLTQRLSIVLGQSRVHDFSTELFGVEPLSQMGQTATVQNTRVLGGRR
jgi:hypothetical protein